MQEDTQAATAAVLAGMGRQHIRGNSSSQPGMQEESDAPEAPVRGRGGRRRESYTPYSAPDYKDGEQPPDRPQRKMLKEATPSQVRGRGEKNGDSDPQIQPADEVEDTAGLPEGEKRSHGHGAGPVKGGSAGWGRFGKIRIKMVCRGCPRCCGDWRHSCLFPTEKAKVTKTGTASRCSDKK